MNKLFTKIATACVGLAMAVGVGVAVGSNNGATRVKAADVQVEFTHTNIGIVDSGNYSKTLGLITLSVTSSRVQANYAQVYKNQTLTLSGATMSEVVFTTVSGNTGTGFGDAPTTGDGELVHNGTTSTWSGSESTLVFTASAKQVRFTSVLVTYSNGSTDKIEVESVSIKENDSVITTKSVSSGFIGDHLSFTASASFKTGTGYETPDNPSFTWASESTSNATVSEGNVTLLSNTNSAINITATANYDVASGGSKVGTVALSIAGLKGSTAETALTVAEAKTQIDKNTTSTIPNMYVKGIISQIDSYDDTHKSITYWISADGKTTGQQFEVYSGKGLDGADFSAITDLQVGQLLVLKGDAKLYNSTYEYNYNSQIISKENPTRTLDSISLSGEYQTVFDKNDEFNHDNLIVTASYSEDYVDDAVVTEYAVFSSPDMTTAGVKTITVTYSEGNVEKTASYDISVCEVLTVIASIKSGTYYTNSTLLESNFDVTATWSNGKANTNPTSGFSWTVNGEENGSLLEGNNAVVVTYLGVSSSSFNVVGTTVHAESIELGDNFSIGVGGSKQLTPTVTPSGYVDAITYSSDDSSKVSVDNNGVVTGVSAGSAVITATVNGHSDTVTITAVETSASVTITEISAAGSGTGYSKYNGTRTIDDVDIVSSQVMPSTGSGTKDWLQFQRNNGTLYNHEDTPMSSGIKMIKVSPSSKANLFTVKFSENEAGSDPTNYVLSKDVITIGDAAYYLPNGEGNYSYFSMKYGDATGVFSEIKILTPNTAAEEFAKVYLAAYGCTNSGASEPTKTSGYWNASNSLTDLYSALAANVKSILIHAVDVTPHDESYSNDIERFAEQYYWTVYNHGSDYDFMGRITAGTISTKASASNGVFGFNSESQSTSLAITLIISLVGVTAIGGYFLLRKKKEQ